MEQTYEQLISLFEIDHGSAFSSKEILKRNRLINFVVDNIKDVDTLVKVYKSFFLLSSSSEKILTLMFDLYKDSDINYLLEKMGNSYQIIYLCMGYENYSDEEKLKIFNIYNKNNETCREFYYASKFDLSDHNLNCIVKNVTINQNIIFDLLVDYIDGNKYYLEIIDCMIEHGHDMSFATLKLHKNIRLNSEIYENLVKRNIKIHAQYYALLDIEEWKILIKDNIFTPEEICVMYLNPNIYEKNKSHEDRMENIRKLKFLVENGCDITEVMMNVNIQ